MKKNTLAWIISLTAAIAALAGALAVIYKVMKKHLKFSVEVLPEDIQDDNELTAAVDVVDIDIPEEKEAEPEIEIAFTEEYDAIDDEDITTEE